MVRQPWEYGLLRLRRVGELDDADQHGKTDSLHKVARLKLFLSAYQSVVDLVSRQEEFTGRFLHALTLCNQLQTANLAIVEDRNSGGSSDGPPGIGFHGCCAAMEKGDLIRIRSLAALIALCHRGVIHSARQPVITTR